MKNYFNNSGFFLIEAIIYLGLVSFFILLLFQFTVETYKKYSELSFNNSNLFILINALDLISKDIQRANSNSKNWKKITDNEIIFTVKNTDISWKLKDNKLFKIEGEYDTNNFRWKNKIESLAASNLKQVVFKANKFLFASSKLNEPNIKFVYVSLENQKFKLEKIIATHLRTFIV